MGQLFQHHQSVQIKLCPSIREQATHIAQTEGVSLNYFISMALAEKMKRMNLQQDGHSCTGSME